MSSTPAEARPVARHLELRLGEADAVATAHLTTTDGTTTATSMRVAYRPTIYGLSRWTDPDDGRRYVIGSGALDGAAHFLAAGGTGLEAPADRMPTTITVVPPVSDSDQVVRTTSGHLASHHLGIVAGPWQVVEGRGAELLHRRSLDARSTIAALRDDTRRALDWLTAWCGTPPPWGETYTQVLVPQAPWLAMEHPGCVLLSERLLRLSAPQRMAVLAHEAAHQWWGNLVSPQRWSDVGVLEGMAELLGQDACAALVGSAAAAELARRRRRGSAALTLLPDDPRTHAATAGLAEVAGPVQHADLLRQVRREIGPVEFRARARRLLERAAAATCTAEQVWATLGTTPRAVPRVRVPVVVDEPMGRPWRTTVSDLASCDPATAVHAARAAFRSSAPGLARVRQGLAVLADPSTPPPVAVGVAAEIFRVRKQENPLLV